MKYQAPLNTKVHDKGRTIDVVSSVYELVPWARDIVLTKITMAIESPGYVSYTDLLIEIMDGSEVIHVIPVKSGAPLSAWNSSKLNVRLKTSKDVLQVRIKDISQIGTHHVMAVFVGETF